MFDKKTLQEQISNLEDFFSTALHYYQTKKVKVSFNYKILNYHHNYIYWSKIQDS